MLRLLHDRPVKANRTSIGTHMHAACAHMLPPQLSRTLRSYSQMILHGTSAIDRMEGHAQIMLTVFESGEVVHLQELDLANDSQRDMHGHAGSLAL